MKQILILLLFLLNINSFSQVHVNGYYRSNGTYVQPHERTVPNSTITDNYSYPGNYNPNTNSVTPTPNYNNSTNNSSLNNTGKTWVDGYYRNNGTYVNGYYRNSSSSNNSNNTYNTTPTYMYVKSKKINVRTSPSANSDIYTTLDWNQSVKTLNTYGNWVQVELSTYNNNTYSYENITGYINSSLLSETYNKENLNDNSYNPSNERNYNNHYIVIKNKAFFYTKPDNRYIRKAFLLYGDEIISLIESKYYIYIVFRNIYNQTSKGWINKDDLQLN